MIKFLIIGTFIFTMLIITQSCEKEGGNETKISSYGSKESHKAGQNCMSCHKPDGSGEGWFTIAGTVYNNSLDNPYKNATIKLFTGPDETGDLKQTIQGDAKGNFYTTESIDFGDGLYTSVQGNSNTKYMLSKISDGRCNNCHGSSTDRIWTD